MKTGDPKKALALIVIALVVLGVAVVRILPKNDATPRSAAVAEEEAKATSGPPEGSLALRGDPFYHPRLEAPSVPMVEPGSGGSVISAPPESTLPYLFGRALPDAWERASIEVRPEAGGKPDPAESTGKNQQPKETRKVVLNAVMSVARPYAYFSVDGEEYRVGMGDKLPGIGTVAVLSARSVTVITARRKVVFAIGEAVEL